MRLKALIFDVDGTLADTEEAHRRAFNEAFQQYGLDWNWSKPKYAELLRTTGGKERIGTYVQSLTLGADARGALLGLVPEIHATKTEIYTRLVSEGQVALRDGVARLLREAEAAGVRLAIASTTTFANIEALLVTNLGQSSLGMFGVIGAGDQVQHKKPAPDIYQWVLGELNLAARHCAAFEDSGNGLAAAKAAGLFTVVTPSYWTRDEDFAGADLVLPSLGSRERPLLHRAASLVGAPVLGLVEIDRLLKDHANMHIAHQN
jgi:beta-phosphoglucomutase-like phosphatase (HAD superfamily)